MVQKIDATDVPIVCLPKVVHADAPGALHAPGAAAPGELRQDLPGPAHPHHQARLHQPRRERQAVLLQPVREGVRRGVGGGSGGPRALRSWPTSASRTRTSWRSAARSWRRSGRTRGRRPADRTRPCCTRPTWEGWDGNPGNTSVILAGENIVRALLADPGVRLLYKPHPMTGSVDPRAGAANARIQAMIAGGERGSAAGERPGPEAAAELARRTDELDRADHRRRSAAARTRWSGCCCRARPEPGRAAAVAAADRRLGGGVLGVASRSGSTRIITDRPARACSPASTRPTC